MMIWTKKDKKTDMSQHTELVVQLWVWDNSLQSKLNKTIEANSQANKIIKCEIEKNINYKKISKNKISQPRLL
jgi:RNA-binding protein YhbY